MVNLSPRQREVANLAIQGKSAKEIASALRLSPATISVYLHDVYVKFGLSGPGAGKHLILRGKELLGSELLGSEK